MPVTEEELKLKIYNEFHLAYGGQCCEQYTKIRHRCWMKQFEATDYAYQASILFHQERINQANGLMAEAIIKLYKEAVIKSLYPITPFNEVLELLTLAINLAGTITVNTMNWGLNGAMEITKGRTQPDHPEIKWEITNYKFFTDGKTRDIRDILSDKLNTISHLKAHRSLRTNKETLFNAIMILPEKEKKLLLKKCLDPGTALGHVCWQKNGLFECSLKKGILKKMFTELKTIDRDSNAVKYPIKHAYTTCAGFFGLAPDAPQSESNLDSTTRHLGHVEMGKHLLNANNHSAVYRLEKKAVLSAIMTLGIEDQKTLLADCKNENHVLGQRFWKKEGFRQCSEERGTLKQIDDMLKQLNSPHRL